VTDIEIIHSVKEMQTRSDRMRREGRVIVFVPTMGYLHEGHLSLMRQGLKHGEELVVSIYVNPTQFSPQEDLATYPRNFENDVEQIRNAGGSVVFAPNDREIYGRAYQTFVTLKQLPRHLCGISRPIHFSGVATVVTKLFNIVKPHVAVFGRKDYQQLVIIRQMVKDLNFDIKIVDAPIVREEDGLAMSSRNAYLTPEQRIHARVLHESLQKAHMLVESGETQAAKIIDTATALISARPDTHIDYISVCDPETLDDVKTIRQPVCMALAVKVGTTRLIDNIMLTPKT
jgi:pantoate--beta-alanine ligase